MTFETTEDAFHFVSSAAYFKYVAVVSLTTSQAYFASLTWLQATKRETPRIPADAAGIVTVIHA